MRQPFIIKQIHLKKENNMKKTFLLLALVLTMGSTTFASGGVDIDLGFKVGYKTSKLSYHKEDIQAGFMNNFTLGLFGRFEFGGFYVQPEVLWFNSKDVFDLSTNVSVDTIIGGITIPSGGYLDFTLKATNFQVPILIGYKYDVMDIIGIRAQVGPTLNFTIPQKTLVNQTVGDTEPTEISNETFDTKTIAFGLQFGVGVDLFKSFTIDINYNPGITKVFGANIINNTQLGNYLNTDNISNAYTNMFMVTVGYKFL